MINISEIETSIKNILSESSIQSSNNVYEKNNNGYKLVIDFKNLYNEKTNIIFTKLIFYVDENKMYLLENDNEYQFKYLYDINCNYKNNTFENILEFETKFSKIINNNIFGKDIKILSDFIKSPSTLINTWFSNNNIKNISVYEVKLDEKYKIIPCKSLHFDFIINLNNQIKINLTLKKETNKNYILTFKIYDKTIEEERPNLSTFIQTIGETIKTKYV
jgi:hypothetical protein